MVKKKEQWRFRWGEYFLREYAGIKKIKLNLVLEGKGLYFLNAGKIALVVKAAFCRVRKQIPRFLYK